MFLKLFQRIPSSPFLISFFLIQISFDQKYGKFSLKPLDYIIDPTQSTGVTRIIANNNLFSRNNYN